MIPLTERNEGAVKIKQDDGDVTVIITTGTEEETVEMHDADEITVKFDAGIDQSGRGTAFPIISGFRYDRFKSENRTTYEP